MSVSAGLHDEHVETTERLRHQAAEGARAGPCALTVGCGFERVPQNVSWALNVALQRHAERRRHDGGRGRSSSWPSRARWVLLRSCA
jgi:hypothetical protein